MFVRIFTYTGIQSQKKLRTAACAELPRVFLFEPQRRVVFEQRSHLPANSKRSTANSSHFANPRLRTALTAANWEAHTVTRVESC